MQLLELFGSAPIHHGGVLGFTVGELRASLRPAELALQERGFVYLGSSSGLQRAVFEHANPARVDATVALTFDVDERLASVMVIIEGDAFVDSASAEAAVSKLREDCAAALGAPTFELDEVQSWAYEGGLDIESACAYSACWASKALAPAKASSVTEYMEFVRCVPGPTATVGISSEEDERGRGVVLVLKVEA